jgi:cytochrome subunit of sulfide dehydrogenase
MHVTRLTAAVAFALFMGVVARAADAPPGAVACSGCHAANPRVDTALPPLNGRPAADIAKEMIAFKSGERKGTIMDRIAKGFSDEEIQAIAVWYAAQK